MVGSGDLPSIYIYTKHHAPNVHKGRCFEDKVIQQQREKKPVGAHMEGFQPELCISTV